MQQSELDPCLFFRFYENTIQGIIALHVDDMLIAGSNVFHEKVCILLRGKYPYKHWVDGEGKFLGRHVKQMKDLSVVIDQSEYANKVKCIEISKERREEKDQPITSNELKQFRGVLGAADWIVGSTRPDIAAATGLLQQRIGHAQVSDLINANQLVSKIRDHAHVKITVKSIPFEKAMLVATSDANWGNTETLGSQAGYFIMSAEKCLENNEWSNLSPWRCKSY